MSRRSSRLVSGGYYNSDDESDSSSVTNISYRENPVKVFKKKTGTRKSAPSRANSSARSVGPDPPSAAAAADQDDGLSPSPLRAHSQTQLTMTTMSYVSTAATPRPPLTTSWTPPTFRPLAPPEKSLYAGRPAPQRSHKELLSQSGVDSSGYSSSEGPRKPAAATSSTSKSSRNSGAPSAGYWDRISCSFCSLKDSVSLMAAALQSRIMRLAALAHASVSGRMKKACGLFLLLIALLCIWLLLPFFTPLVSCLAVTMTSSHSKPDPAVVSAAVEARIQHLLDSSLVSAAVEAKMTHVLEEQQLKQEHLLSQVKERFQLELQDVKVQLEAAAVDSDDRRRLEQEVSGLVQRMMSYQTYSRSTDAGLRLRIQALEAQNAKLSLEWSSIQLRPPPAPCPDTSSPPVQNHLTPELQQAMQKWFTDRLKKQDDRGSCSDCGRPIADKMADFALETQGASVISTRCSETYRVRSACVTLFGIPLWYPSESPRTVIQGYPVLLPGKCWAFHGVQGSLVISLSHPITLTHVTLDHLPRCNAPAGRIDSAPKDFEVYGMKDDVEEGTLLGTFTYDEDGESTQTFRLPNPSDVVHRCVELRVLSNWGHVEYTCLYRFRVHGQIAATR